MENTLWSTSNDTLNLGMNQEDWFNQGKSDAWAEKPKSPPEDVLSASMYDLGYNEGGIERSPKSHHR